MADHKSRNHRYALAAVAVWISMSAVPTLRGFAEESLDTPMTRLQPIGAPSAVDQFRNDDNHLAGQRHTVRLMQFEAPQLPTDAPPMAMPTNPTLAPPVAPPTIMPSPGFGNPGMTNPGMTNPGTQTVMPPTAPPRGLPMNPVPTMQPVPSSSDLAPLAAPQLHDGFATIDNCCCVSAPSDYVAATGWGNCSNVAYQAPAPQAYIAPSTQVVGPSIVTTPVVGAPVAGAPVVVAPPANPRAAGIPKKPLLNFGQDKNPVVVGQGLVGPGR